MVSCFNRLTIGILGTTIVTYGVALIFLLIIGIAPNSSYGEYPLNLPLKYDTNDGLYIFYATLYHNGLSIERHYTPTGKYSNYDVEVLSTCTFQEIKSSVNKSCGYLDGITNIDQITQQLNKINIYSIVTGTYLLVLVLIYIGLPLWIYFSFFYKVTSHDYDDHDHTKRMFLLNNLQFLYLPSLIPTSILMHYILELDNLFYFIENVGSNGNSSAYAFIIISIIYNLAGAIALIVYGIIIAFRKRDNFVVAANDLITPGEKYSIPLITKK